MIEMKEMVNLMTYYDDELDNELKDKLELLQETPLRDPETARRQREAYRRQVLFLQFGKPLYLVASLLQRRTWQHMIRQRPAWVPFAAALLLIFSMVLGGAGTVYAAKDSLPNSPLYTIKLTSEDLHLAFTADALARISLLTTYTDRRLEEAASLASLGQPIPDELPDLVQTYFNELLLTAVSLEDPIADEAIKGIQIHLRDRDQDMSNAMNGQPEDVDPQLTRLLEMVQAQRKLTQQRSHGESEAYKLRNQQARPITSTLTSTITTTLGTTIEITLTRTITPGQHGPGPCELPGQCTPAGNTYGTGPFHGTPPAPDDPDGWGPGPQETPMYGEQPPAYEDNAKYKFKGDGAGKKGK
jgi:hypothetical protein